MNFHSKYGHLKGKDISKSSMVIFPLSKEARIPPEFTKESTTSSLASLVRRLLTRLELCIDRYAHTIPYHIILCHTNSYRTIPYYTIPYYAIQYINLSANQFFKIPFRFFKLDFCFFVQSF